MAGLMLKMPAGDRIVLNGAVVENAGRGARLRILTPDTQLLRLRDAIDPTGRATPVGRVAYALQLVLIGERQPEEAVPELQAALAALRLAFCHPADRAIVDEITLHLSEGRFYQALRRAIRLRRREAELLPPDVA
jgi:flagellar protein FlbT